MYIFKAIWPPARVDILWPLDLGWPARGRRDNQSTVDALVRLALWRSAVAAAGNRCIVRGGARSGTGLITLRAVTPSPPRPAVTTHKLSGAAAPAPPGRNHGVSH